MTGLSALCLCAASMAQSADRPATKAGDTWVYRDTNEMGPMGWKQTRDEFTVTRVTPSSIYYAARESGSSQSPGIYLAGADWSRIRAVNGKETVVNRPLNFPLTPGKTWTLQYREDHPNKAHKFEEWDTRYTVVGTETVTVPGGTFNAIKVEAEGTWKAEIEPSNSVVQGAQTTAGSTSMTTEVRYTVAAPFEGRTYKALWYVPEVHRWVKVVEEYYGSDGVRTERQTSELESFKLAN